MLTEDGVVRIDRLANWSHAPGYRDISLIVEVDIGGQFERTTLNFTKEDALKIAYYILDTNDLAWNNGPPIDALPNEKRPHFVMPFGSRQDYGIER